MTTGPCLTPEKKMGQPVTKATPQTPILANTAKENTNTKEKGPEKNLGLSLIIPITIQGKETLATVDTAA